MDAEAYLNERTPLVDRLLEEVLPPAEEAPQSLHAAMRHLVFPGGKRLRPALAMAAAEACGAATDAALPAAAAAELVHTYSLIHDDLPCMDDDDERRGRPSVHVAFGEATALLAGDALLALAFEAASAAAMHSGPALANELVAELARTAGSRELVGGQVDDLAADADSPEAAAIESIHARKSAALITFSIWGGGLLAGAEASALAALRRFGHDVGVAFQIADDVLDEDEDGGGSLVRVLGTDAARARAEELLDGALALIEDWGERAEPLRELARFAARRTR